MYQATNRYEQFSVVSLLRAVQQCGHLLSISSAKTTPAQKRRKMIDDIRPLQTALMSKLEKMDRMDPHFFPVGAFVGYNQIQSDEDFFDFSKQREPARYGIVKGHEGQFVIVQFDREENLIRANPINLKLRFVRSVG